MSDVPSQPSSAGQNPGLQPGQTVLQPNPAAVFNENAVHMLKPKIRRLRGFQVPVRNQNGQVVPMLGLADQQQIAQKVVVTVPAFQQVLPLMDGSRSVGQIVHEVGKGLNADQLKHFVAQMDDAGLLYGPTFEGLRAKMRSDFDSSNALPPGVTAQFADSLVAQALQAQPTEQQKAEMGPGKVREQLDKWIDELFEKLPEGTARQYDKMPRGVVGPQLDYQRGWVNYASAWGRFRGTGMKPDRIVLLGTNNFGEASGVTGCDKAFVTPLGTLPVDEALLGKLRGQLGVEDAGKLMEHRYDHEREHSVELHLPWIQHVFGQGEVGDIKVLAALVHDPMVKNGESYDGKGLALQPFMTALRAAIAELPGTTLVVGSANLSHVGPQFGDKQPLAPVKNQQGQVVVTPEQAQAFRDRVTRHDQDMLKILVEKKPDELVGALAWQQNPTRWNAVGSLVAAMKVVEPDEFRVLNYGVAMDQQGMAMVSSVSAAMF